MCEHCDHRTKPADPDLSGLPNSPDIGPEVLRRVLGAEAERQDDPRNMPYEALFGHQHTDPVVEPAVMSKPTQVGNVKFVAGRGGDPSTIIKMLKEAGMPMPDGMDVLLEAGIKNAFVMDHYNRMFDIVGITANEKERPDVALKMLEILHAAAHETADKMKAIAREAGLVGPGK